VERTSFSLSFVGGLFFLFFSRVFSPHPVLLSGLIPEAV